ncbi:MAG: hypothetical protein M1150_04130 [Patescibacteria group bacterium]|nr:hypothetical protein [Patescibacteria group bacterium]
MILLVDDSRLSKYLNQPIKHAFLIIIFAILAISLAVTVFIFIQPSANSAVLTTSKKTSLEYLSADELPIFPKAESFTPKLENSPDVSKNAKYYRLNGTNKLEEIYSWYKAWFDKNGYPTSETKNLDGSWSIAANTDKETKALVAGFYQDNYNVLEIR